MSLVNVKSNRSLKLELILNLLHHIYMSAFDFFSITGLELFSQY